MYYNIYVLPERFYGGIKNKYIFKKGSEMCMVEDRNLSWNELCLIEKYVAFITSEFDPWDVDGMTLESLTFETIRYNLKAYLEECEEDAKKSIMEMLELIQKIEVERI